MSQTILSLDFYGNEMIAALASFDEKTATLRLRQIFRQPCRAFSGALVRDMDTARTELARLLSKLNQFSLSNPSVIVGLRGPFLSYKHSRGFQSVASRSRVVSNRDIDAAIRDSVPTSLSEMLEVVDILPQSYVIDGNEGIVNPLGMTGCMLEAETFLSCALNTHLQTLHTLLKDCGCEDYQELPSVVALGETLLKPEEKINGTILVDLGTTHTSAILYQQGSLVDAWELTMGQDTLVEMVADLMQNDLPTVRRLLEEYTPGSDEVMDDLLEDAQIKLLEKLKKELLQSSLPYLKHPAANLILCGTMTDKPFQKLVKKIFNVRRVRIGNADYLRTDCADDSPAAAGAVSLLYHFLEREQVQSGIQQPKEKGLISGFLNKFNQLFE